jgi:hypothetical protein
MTETRAPALPTETMAVLSTAHVTPRDLEILEQAVTDPEASSLTLRGFERETGILIAVQRDKGYFHRQMTELAETDLSPSALYLFEAAHEQGHAWLLLDQDVVPVDGFNVFDW